MRFCLKPGSPWYSGKAPFPRSPPCPDRPGLIRCPGQTRNPAPARPSGRDFSPPRETSTPSQGLRRASQEEAGPGQFHMCCRSWGDVLGPHWPRAASLCLPCAGVASRRADPHPALTWPINKSNPGVGKCPPKKGLLFAPDSNACWRSP